MNKVAVLLPSRQYRCATVVPVLLASVAVSLVGITVLAAEAAGFQDLEKAIRSGVVYDEHGRVVKGPEIGRVVHPSAPAVPTPTQHPGGGQQAPLKSTLADDPDAPPVALEWYSAAYGTGIGYAGMVVGDVDGDGDLEMVASASPGGFSSNTYWYLFGPDGSDYSMIWANPPYDETLYRLTAAQLDGDAALEILIALAGRLLIYDGQTLEQQAEIPISPSSVYGLDVANVDGDAALEAAICDPSGTWVYDLDSGAEQLDLSGTACRDLAIGETDGTLGLEIVIADGSNPGLVIDAVSGAVEWSHQLGFGDLLALGDLDGDTMDEIVAGFSWSGLQVWNGDTHGYAWGASIFNLATVLTGDVEDDGPIEVVYGDAQWGDVHVLDGTNGVEKWSVSNPEHGVTRIAIGDLDDSGVNEIFFGAGFTSTGEDHLYVVDTVAHSLVWQTLDFGGPFLGLAAGDVDADGVNELVSTCFDSNSGYDDGLYFVHDAVTKALEYASGPPTGLNWNGLWDVELADIDADPELEIFLPTSYIYDGVLQCRDGGSHAVQWEATLPSDLSFASLEIADADADGTLEVVSGVIGGPGMYVYLHNAETGGLDWESFDLQSFFAYLDRLTLLRVVNIDGDPAEEVLVAERGSDILALDPVAFTIDMATTGLVVTAFEVADVDGGGSDDIVIGTEGGLLQIVDPVTGAPTTLGGPFAGAIDGLAVAELTGDTMPDFVFASNDQVFLVDGATMAPVWVSDDLGTEVGRYDSLVVDDLDLDGRQEIWVNAGPIGHFIFEVGPPAGLIFRDGFESGETSAWHSTVP
jgi:hypothetical protein